MLGIRKLLCVFFLVFASGLQAQEFFVIDGDTLQLTKEVNGTLSLYSDQQGADVRYFVAKGKRMLELKDSLENGVYQYRVELERLTANEGFSAAGVDFTVASIAQYVRQYNTRMTQAELAKAEDSNFSMRLGFFTGLTNSIYTENPNNVLAPLIGVEFEILNPNRAPRHSAVLELEQTFKQNEYRYTATQFSVNYRFRFLRLDRLELYAEASLLRLLYAKDQREIVDESGELIALNDDSEFRLQAPLSLGIGAVLQVTSKGYITFGYKEVVSVTLDSNGSFPIDFSIGYKYEL